MDRNEPRAVEERFAPDVPPLLPHPQPAATPKLRHGVSSLKTLGLRPTPFFWVRPLHDASIDAVAIYA